MASCLLLFSTIFSLHNKKKTKVCHLVLFGCSYQRGIYYGLNILLDWYKIIYSTECDGIFMSVLQDYIPDVIHSKKYHVKMGVIINGYRAIDI
jgi:hypothetical protein